MANPKNLRYQDIDVCSECEACAAHSRCEPVRKPLRSYNGIRFTSDGFDCALPVSIDSHSICSYACRYCFSDNLVQHRENREKPIGQTSLSAIENLFSGSEGKKNDNFRKALKYDRRNAAGYPCPVQLGAICDPCDHIERQQGWLIKFMELAIKYNQPVRMSTKGTVLGLKDYLQVISKAPNLFWVAFSIITPDDELIQKIDLRAPNASARLGVMKQLSDIGVKTSLRFRPMMPNVSDKTKKYPEAYRILIEKAAEAGAVAISYEVAFVAGAMNEDLKRRWTELSRLIKVPMETLYRSFGGHSACMRPPYTWTENIMHAVYEVAHKNGLVVGVSDPVWKQLNDTGCCCGILPDDPVFGNWQRESATNQFLEARDNGKVISADDIIPEWGKYIKFQDLVNVGVGPLSAYKHRHGTWADKLTEIFNSLDKERCPLKYFQGALLPKEIKPDGSVSFAYKGLERSYPKKTPYWSVPPGYGKDLTRVTKYVR